MTKGINILSLLFVFSLVFTEATASDNPVLKEIEYDGYTFMLSYDTTEFFLGKLSVEDNNGNMLFEDSGFYSNCYLDTLVDLNSDGSKELILGLTTGASPYLWSEMLVFDISDGKLKTFRVVNGRLVTAPTGNIYIEATTRISPAYLGALYSYLLELKDGRLRLADASENPDVQTILGSNETVLEETISYYETQADECTDKEDYLRLFEAYLIQARFSGRQLFSQEFFRKTYKCNDVNTAFMNADKYAENVFEIAKNDGYLYEHD